MLIAVSGWMNDRQLLVIDYLREENGFSASSLVAGECGSMIPRCCLSWRILDNSRFVGKPSWPAREERCDLTRKIPAGTIAPGTFGLNE